MSIRPRRSLLYMPGSNPRALDKARSLPADGLILDMEDSVAPDAKALAREQIGAALAQGGYGHRELMVRINLAGENLAPGARSPSSEWCMHTRILQRKSQANAVIHAHAPNATILANCGLPFLPISTEAAFFGNIPRVPFLMPGTPELADAVADAMEDEWAVLMINHGIIVAGRNLRRAADMVEIIERSAEVILGCYAVGKEPPLLPADAVDYCRKLGDIVA